jgi:hypothetical protein
MGLTLVENYKDRFWDEDRPEAHYSIWWLCDGAEETDCSAYDEDKAMDLFEGECERMTDGILRGEWGPCVVELRHISGAVIESRYIDGKSCA